VLQTGAPLAAAGGRPGGQHHSVGPRDPDERGPANDHRPDGGDHVIDASEFDDDPLMGEPALVDDLQGAVALVHPDGPEFVIPGVQASESKGPWVCGR